MTRKLEDSFGSMIRKLREEKGLTMEGLSRDTGYPPEVLRDVEEGKIAPPVSLVLQLSRTLKTDIEPLQARQEKEASKKRVKGHKKRVASYAYTPLTQPTAGEHLRAYLVTVEPKTEHKGVEYHHEGEEFVYVLEGEVIVRVGQNSRALKEGDTFHFNSSLHHTHSNPTNQKAELLVVIYVP